MFITMFGKTYDPMEIDKNLFSMYGKYPRCVPLISTCFLKENVGQPTVNGKPINWGHCVKIPVCPLPVYFLPIGEVATEADKDYRVELKGYRSQRGFPLKRVCFNVHTNPLRRDDSRFELDAVSLRSAEEGAVLLSNNGVLPLPPRSPIALLGEWGEWRYSIVGAGHINPRYVAYPQEELAKVFSIDKSAKTGLFCLSRGSAENIDNRAIEGDYYLTAEEKTALIDARQLFDKLILVLNIAYPVEMRFIIEQVKPDAILHLGIPGAMGGKALANILSGKISPSGRLPISFPFDIGDEPAASNFPSLDPKPTSPSRQTPNKAAHVYYEEGIYVGYRYFDTFGKPVAFPFGHGLSYGKFEVIGAGQRIDNNVNIKFDVTNIGPVDAATSVLVYVRPPKGKVEKPKTVFAGFGKTPVLKPKEKATVEIAIPLLDFSSFDEANHRFVLEKGDYEFGFGGSVSDFAPLFAFSLADDLILKQSKDYYPCLVKMKGLTDEGKGDEHPLIVPYEECLRPKASFRKKVFSKIETYSGPIVSFPSLKKHPELLDKFIGQLNDKELLSLVVLQGADFGLKGSGKAGFTGAIDRLGLPAFSMADGNSGLNTYTPATGFPSSLTSAASFNKDLFLNIGEAIGQDYLDQHTDIALGPAGNLVRHPLCGRAAEYFSEDPILAGTLMAYQARGLHSKGILTTYKHFLANNSETLRKQSQSIIEEKSLRELYLKVFEKAISLERPDCIMTSYNAVNGIYPSQQAAILNDYLEGELGFAGLIMTDWDAYDTADPILSLQAGTSMLTPGEKKWRRRIAKAYRQGKFDRYLLRDAASRVVKTLMKIKE